MKNKHLCVHVHFGRMPKVDPWRGAAEPDDAEGARLLEECYAANAASPLPGPRGEVRELANNYADLSFSFAPGLFAWIGAKRPSLVEAVREGDAAGAARRRGHGNALAGAYAPAILPLAFSRDKRTLVRWGMDDFQARFGRRAEGFWLPESAADDETLETLVSEGLRFAVLSSTQADAAPGQPGLWRSRSDSSKSLALFFYNQALSRGLAAGELLEDGRALHRRVLASLRPDDSTEILTLACAAESAGLGRPLGAESLSLALRLLQEDGVTVTNFGRFLELYPPPVETRVKPGSSGTCPHGTARWSGDCLCRSEAAAARLGLEWRAPLRQTLDWLGRGLDQAFELRGREFFHDSWKARDAYGMVLAGSGEAALDEFLAKNAKRRLSPMELPRALALLESQRHRLLAFSAAAWDGESLESPESVQSLREAACAMDLAGEPALAAPFREQLARLTSSPGPRRNGLTIYSQEVEPRRIGLERAAAAFALLGLWEEADPEGSAHGFEVAVSGALRRARMDRGFFAARMEVTRLSTRERLGAVVVAHRRDRLDMAAWVSGADTDIPALAAAFEALGDDEFRREVSRALRRDPWGYEALFPEDRGAVTRAVLGSRPETPQRRFWRDSVRAGRRLRFTGDNIEEVLALAARAPDLGISREDLPYLDALRDRVVERLAFLVRRRAGDAAHIERLFAVARDPALAVGRPLRRALVWRWKESLAEASASGEPDPRAPAQNEAARQLVLEMSLAEGLL